MLITEQDLRTSNQQSPLQVLNVPPKAIITPAAWQFIRDQRIKVVWAKGGSEGDLAEAGPKPEELTHLNAHLLVPKTHPRIALRGQLDLLQCQIIQYQVLCQQFGRVDLVAELEEIAYWARGILSAEVKESGFEFGSLLGFNEQEIHERSHQPQKYYGLPHTLPSYEQGPVVSGFNLLRSQARVCELAAIRCFVNEDGQVERPDIIKALNRLSSLFYLLVCRELARIGQDKQDGQARDARGVGDMRQDARLETHLDVRQNIWQDKVAHMPGQVKLGPITVGVSNRHVHLDQKALTELFGSDYCLQVAKQLSQPGQFAAQETVTVAGPKGVLRNVRILGPVRRQTQVELSVTDTFTLGIPAQVRDSGDLAGTPGVELLGPAGRVKLPEGAIVPSRHLHLSLDEAEQWRLRNGQVVDVLVEGQTQLTFAEVLVRVSSGYKKELHLTTDEGNAAILAPKAEAWIVGLGR